MRTSRPHVVIIGAGFGGLQAAKSFARQPVDVTLVDRHNYHTFQPLLYQVATAGLNAADVAHPVRAIFQRQRNLSFRHATVTGADWERRIIHLERPGGEPGELAFDHLIVAAGATAAFFGIRGAAEHSFPLYSLTDAIAVRNHILDRFEAADADPGLIDAGALTFVVVGGGPTGVEVVGALAELFAAVLRKDFHDLDVGKARIILVEMVDHLLTPFSPQSRRHALDTLASRGVEVRLGEAVEEVTATHIRLRSGEEVPTHTLIWAAGVQANAVAGALGVQTGRAGRIVVEPDLRITGRDDAYAIGDVAELIDLERGLLPQVAQVAIQSGRLAAANIGHRRRGEPTEQFSYRDKGIMATIGRRSAVTELPHGIRLRGTIAWVAWLGLHLILLIGFRNRASVLLNWAWNYLTWDRGPRLILRRDAG
ncbi:MAG: NAD(P)/FAD-dependent oxidoreductase [Acidimicrobiales bacterium]